MIKLKPKPKPKSSILKFQKPHNFSTSSSCQDPIKLISKIILTSPKPILEQSLTQSNLSLSPAAAEAILPRFENAGVVAFRFFQWAQSQDPTFAHTIKSYHLTISSLTKIRQHQLIWDLVAFMKRRSLLNVETFSIIIRKYARAHKVNEALYTFNVMDKFAVTPNLAAFNSLLSALCKSSNIRKAQEVFDEMCERFEPDSKTYSILPDSKTYSILLQGWGLEPNLPKMFQVFDEMVDRGCEPDVVTYGIMVDSLLMEVLFGPPSDVFFR